MRCAATTRTRCSIPSEVELGRDDQGGARPSCERVKPKRLVLDSLSEIRLLAQSPLRYRRQVLALKQFFAGRGCTVMLARRPDLGTSAEGTCRASRTA